MNESRENDRSFISILEKIKRHLTESGNVSKTAQQFAKLRSNFQRVQFILSLLHCAQISFTFKEDCKNDEIAARLREKGNDMYRKKELKSALHLYTQSICFAVVNSVNLGLAYANRSAVLLELNLQVECILDIHRAFTSNYPENLKLKLTQRLKRANELGTPDYTKYHEPIPVLNGINPIIHCTDDCLEIQQNSAFGRFIVAKRDIKIGEVLAVENPFCTLLVNELFIHCHHCVKLCFNLIPCKSCTQTLYCGEFCRTQAYESYHKFECSILLTIKVLQFDKLKTLPLRIAIENRNSLQKLEEINIESDGIYCSNRYKEIHNLVSNTDRRSINDLFERATAAAILFNLVKKHTRFFDKKDQQFEQNFQEALLHHMQTAPSNFHEITELVEKGDFYVSEEVASGAFAFLSLLNHSCNPNVTRFCYGSTLVLKSIQNIAKGEQCFDNYGYHFAIMKKAERQAHLKHQYFFNCECTACKDNWPLFGDLHEFAERDPFDERLLTKLSKGDRTVVERTILRSIELLSELQDRQPCKNFCKVQEVIKQCFAILGNRRKLF